MSAYKVAKHPSGYGYIVRSTAKATIASTHATKAAATAAAKVLNQGSPSRNQRVTSGRPPKW